MTRVEIVFAPMLTISNGEIISYYLFFTDKYKPIGGELDHILACAIQP